MPNRFHENKVKSEPVDHSRPFENVQTPRRRNATIAARPPGTATASTVAALDVFGGAGLLGDEE